MKNYSVGLGGITLVFLFGFFIFISKAQAAVVDISASGACTSSTDDDTAKVQTVLNNLANGDTLNISCLTSINGTGLRLTGKSNITINGSSSGAGFKATVAAGQGIPGFGPYMLVLDNCSGCQVKNLEFNSASLKVGGFGITGSANATFSGNYLHDVVGNVTGGAMASSLNTDLRILNNRIERTSRSVGSNEDPRGMWLGNGDLEEVNLYVEGNIIKDVAGTGIAFHAKGFTLLKNTVERTNGACIKHAYGGSEPTQLIAENILKNCKFNGIQIKDQGNHTVANLIIRDNTIELNGSPEGGPGIAAFTRLENSQILRNKILNNNRPNLGGWLGGVYIQGANGLTIADNEIYDSGDGTGKQFMGIYLEALQNSSNVTIKNNLFKNHSLAGIILGQRASTGSTLSGVNIVDNVFQNNSQVAIKVEENTLNSISAISFSNNCFQGNGINLQDNRGSRSLAQPVSSITCTYPISVTPPSADTQPPSVPTGLIGSGTSATRIDLSWNASNDLPAAGQSASGLAGYRVYRNGVQIGTTPNPQYYDTPVITGTSYAYSVSAYDSAGNVSAQSSSVNITAISGTQQIKRKIVLPLESRTTNQQIGGKLAFFNLQNSQLAEINFTSDALGEAVVDIPVGMPSTANLRVTASGFLARRLSSVNLSDPSLLAVNFSALRAGEFNGDNIVNSLDFSFLSSRWLTADQLADLNRDGTVNVLDFSFLSRNWGQSGE
jgi:hypothetical protein